jgi:hypothetical protein
MILTFYTICIFSKRAMELLRMTSIIKALRKKVQLYKGHRIFANTSDSRLEQLLYYRKALNHSTMDQKLLPVQQSGKSPYHISISSVLIIKNMVKLRQYWRMSTRVSQLMSILSAAYDICHNLRDTQLMRDTSFVTLSMGILKRD